VSPLTGPRPPNSPPTGWTAEQWSRLHPAFAADLAPALEEAEKEGLKVRPRSLDRSNARQRELRNAYLKAKARWESTLRSHQAGDHRMVPMPGSCPICWTMGRKTVPEPRAPLPAAKPGASSHNFGLCSLEPDAHPHTADDACPKCGAPWKPATVAVDVMLLDDRGTPCPLDDVAIASGGASPLAKRSGPWKRWAAIVARHSRLRDGGNFQNPDPVHCEWWQWDYAAAGLRPA